MNALRIFDSKIDQGRLGLFVHIGESIDTVAAERLLKQLEFIRNRFGVAVVLGMAAPEGFTPSTITKCLSEGVVHQVVCSGAKEYVLVDLFTAAARLPFTTCLFVDATDLLCSFASTLKFIVECLNLDAPFYLSRSGRAAFCKSALVRSADLMVTAESWTEGLVLMARQFVSLVERLEGGDPLRTGEGLGLSSLASIERHADQVSSTPDNSMSKERNGRRHLFVTQSGCQRLGGIGALRNLPLQIGGVSVGNYDDCWILSNGDELPDPYFTSDSGPWSAVSTIDAFSGLGTGDGAIVFDINPAPHRRANTSDSVPEGLIRIPRQVLIVRAVTGMAKGPARDTDALFIVSNYNKKKYIDASLYSLLMQTHRRVRVEFVDDLSTDGSVDRVTNFKSCLGISDDFLVLRSNIVNRGTYWIRNDVIHRHPSKSITFFVNDSDDYSAAQRAFLQLAFLESAPNRDGCFFDIVRIGQDYQLLPLNEEVERYGTASLCFKRSLIDALGFFQNIRKNADSELIERVKKFRGKDALPWSRHPVLFQVFDGENLTSDIYTLRKDRRGISSANNSRPLHVEAFRKHHERIHRKHLELSSEFCFPLATFPKEYRALPTDFFVDGYKGVDEGLLLLGSEIERSTWNPLLNSGIRVLVAGEDGVWRFFSRGGQQFSSDQGFTQAIRQYCIRTGFHGYVFSVKVAGAWMSAPLVSQFALLSWEPVCSHIYKSKQHGDCYALLEREVQIKRGELGQLLDTYATGHSACERITGTSIFFHSSLIS